MANDASVTLAPRQPVDELPTAMWRRPGWIDDASSFPQRGLCLPRGVGRLGRDDSQLIRSDAKTLDSPAVAVKQLYRGRGFGHKAGVVLA
jgi:hypothetical protein